MTAFFTVPSMGVAPRQARHHTGEARDIYAYLQGYTPQRFPGRVDAQLAERGAELRAKLCELPRRLRRQHNGPSAAVFPKLDRRVRYRSGACGSFHARSGGCGQRVCVQHQHPSAIDRPIRSADPPGLWMSAPYLHNGSVPTLWHLMHPAERPARFQVGGHRLNYQRVGIDGAVNRSGTTCIRKDTVRGRCRR